MLTCFEILQGGQGSQPNVTVFKFEGEGVILIMSKREQIDHLSF